MIGHVALFTAAFVAAAAAALGAPARTGSESCPAPVASSRAVVRTSTNLHRHGHCGRKSEVGPGKVEARHRDRERA
jgi:hypothetical protein